MTTAGGGVPTLTRMGFREWDDRRVGDIVLAVGLGALQLFGTAMAAPVQGRLCTRWP